MKERIIESVIGFIVICIAVFSFIFFYRVSDLGNDSEYYILNAYFQNIEGLVKGSDIRVSGIKIGHVDNFSLEKDTYFAITRLKIKKSIEIPSDSRAIVSTNGLFGNKYIRIIPGSGDNKLKENDRIKFTQSPINLEDLISRLLYNLGNKKPLKN